MNEPSRPWLAVLWMSLAIFAFSSMAIAGRELSPELDTFEMLMYRSFIGLFLVLIVAVPTRKICEVRFDNLMLHGVRNLCHFMGQNLWFAAVSLITFAELFALEFTTPIWVLVLSVLFLGEKLKFLRVFAVILGFVGVLTVARPGSGGDTYGLALAAASAIGFAGTIVSTKLLTRSETIVGILFWMTVMQAVIGIAATGWDGDIAWPSQKAWPWLVVLGTAGIIAHTCLTNALMVAPASIVAPLDFVRLPVIAVIGMTFYNEPLDLWIILGAVIIFAGNYLNILAESRRIT